MTSQCLPTGRAGRDWGLDWAKVDRLGSDPLKEDPADALGTELGLLSNSSGCFLVSDAHLFLTALSVLHQSLNLFSCAVAGPALWLMLQHSHDRVPDMPSR